MEHSFLKINEGRGLIRSLLTSPIPVGNKVELIFRMITPSVRVPSTYEADIKRLIYFCEKIKENKVKNYQMYDTEGQIFNIYQYLVFYPLVKKEA